MKRKSYMGSWEVVKVIKRYTTKTVKSGAEHVIMVCRLQKKRCKKKLVKADENLNSVLVYLGLIFCQTTRMENIFSV